MNEPRMILSQELINAGIFVKDANIIALDAGSSQVLVNIEYLNNFQYSEQIKKVALSLVRKFYTGELFEEKHIS